MLLKSGVRIFEWNGPMLHAKTAVADGQWARIGSTNLNPASWVGNWELDVVVENEAFAQEMKQMYENDRERCVKHRVYSGAEEASWSEGVGFC
jgi:cardiolipin synthase